LSKALKLQNSENSYKINCKNNFKIVSAGAGVRTRAGLTIVSKFERGVTLVFFG
jgi:hypothetical protein